MQLDQKSVVNLIKVKDLHAFANSIIEIMIAKDSEDIERQPSKMSENMTIKDMTSLEDSVQLNDKRLFTGGISLDSIPLNWIKMPETKEILKILAFVFPLEHSHSPHHILFFRIFWVVYNNTFCK